MLRRMFLLSLLVLVVALLGQPPLARARPHVVRSLPGDGAVLAEAPAQAQVWFSHDAVVELASVQLVDASGREVHGAVASAIPYQPQQAGLAGQFDSSYLYLCSIGARSLPTLLSVALPPLPAGSFRLSWRALGADDRSAASGGLVFGVRPGAGAASAAAPASASSEVDSLLVTLAVSPDLPGENFLTVSVADTRRPARAPVQGVTLRLRDPSGARGEPLQAQPLGEGRFQVAGDMLQAAGDWKATITLRRPGRADVSADVQWSVASQSQPFPWLGWAAGGALALLGALGALWRARNRARAKEAP